MGAVFADDTNLGVTHEGQTVTLWVDGKAVVVIDVTSVDLIDLIREAADRRYRWLDFEPEPDITGDGSGDPDTHYLTILDPDGEEYAVICHRTVGGKYPLDGPLADVKRRNAQNIVDALNAHK